jgi:pre-mRNA-splicing helicase BRR2
MCAEVVTKTIESSQEAVDYLTWTFMYRRLTQNPNYYNLQGTSHRHLSDHVSELVETTLSDLEAARCISIDDGMEVSPLNLGMIASYYYISYTTIELFSASLQAGTKLRGLVEILASATEYESLPLRHREENVLKSIAMHCPYQLESSRFNTPAAKASVLLQTHFGRRELGRELTADRSTVLEQSTRLLQAMVDVLSSSGWLAPALATMELCQMCVQGMWDRDSSLMQLPHVDQEIAATCAKAGVESIFDLMDMADSERDVLLGFSPSQLSDVARAANSYPSVEVDYEVEDAEQVTAGDLVTLVISLSREAEATNKVPAVHAPRFPRAKEEGWWLLVGNAADNGLLCIKRVTLQLKARIKLEFTAPVAGEQTYTLYLMSDSYLGCDQEYDLPLTVAEAVENEDGDESEGDGD